MAHPNVELVNGIYQAYADGDLPAVRRAYAGNVVLHGESAGVLSGTYSGIDDVMSWMARIGEETNGTWLLEPVRVIADDEYVVALQTASGRRGGKSIKTRQVIVSHVTDGQIDEVWFGTEDGSSLDAFWS